MVKVFCKNSGESRHFNEGTTLLEMLDSFNFEKPNRIVSAKVNNVAEGLKFKVYNNRDVEFLDYSSYSGRSAYCRSLCFLLGKACNDLFPGSRITMRRPISKGFFCNLTKADGSSPDSGDIARIYARMREMVDADLPFRRCEVPIEEALEIFEKAGYPDKVKLLRSCGDVYITYYLLDGTPDYYYDALVPSCGYIQVFGLEQYRGGMLLRVPDRHNPNSLSPFVEQPKTFEVFSENLKWNEIMELDNVGDVNDACLNGKAPDLIQIAEALQEKKIVQIAETIEQKYRNDGVRIVLITGPTSSGKSTFCKRLSIQLMACGLHPVSFSTDDYFVNRLETPKLPDGSFDFDNFETVDHKILENDVMKLLAGETVVIPEYNFVTGLREYNNKALTLGKGSILLIEGIHALNSGLIPQVPSEKQFKIFINTITSISLDDHNCIPTSDNRLLRRIVRDYNKGAFTAQETIKNWPNVRRAESKWIYPYQETADVLFNSAYLVEFAVLKPHAEQILRTVPKNCPEYSEAGRLLNFLHYFIPVSDKDVPATSLLRGFI